MESQPQNPEFRNNPENVHPCIQTLEAQVGHEISELNETNHDMLHCAMDAILSFSNSGPLCCFDDQVSVKFY